MPGWGYLNYHPKIFPKPFEFDPERWNRMDQKMNPYTFTPFSIGARGCLGQHFAMLEAKIVLIKFLDKFQMKLKGDY
jgi:cytochrome P450